MIKNKIKKYDDLGICDRNSAIRELERLDSLQPDPLDISICGDH